MVTIAVTGEREGEPRVAISPDTVKKLTGLGCTVRVQSGAGGGSRFSDAVLQAQGATIAASAKPRYLAAIRRPALRPAAAKLPRHLWHEGQQKQQHHERESNGDHGCAQEAGVGALVLLIVHGGMSAGRVDCH